MTHCLLKVDIRSYWLPGTGRTSGAMIDSTAHRDAQGLPVLPGRHLKGLLRDAMERVALWGWPGYADLARDLFGDRTEEGSPYLPNKGSLRISDARLPEEITPWLHSEEGRDARLKMFRALSSTAIDNDGVMGSAKDKSLRVLEVVIPLSLTARLEPVPGITPPPDWVQHLTAVLPLISAVGAHRNRGLGRAILSLEEFPS
ncbi:RAMP superfamily CRISPR-associated protein [Ferrovum myxofaciens]|jgi:hypothetical protein|uniref:CRISPR type III-associated protein domain-containing protein n=1 Tax=Ferrovum myxofaciens TaxID=416213 RepID=A0A9E6MXG9_9PROT|nr:RAMP superfamily CRISPR-associated protein [Ferrovum myxofaciens]MBU6995020.1 hypothetical protein [Ferrovum myxofaciens]QKE38820.1 MAG: hypothetical protein HO273_08785 [Ferrovum myxofaciens]QKE41407.1 MAG: hypothetical protein HO274_08820 [Ferrovum myxofaciens]QWY74030.1 MAG: hypothetical protein JVY19_09305 [Ferrovum myxofaciens]QWY76782.1 MAG: hypothetical protein JZL65_09760 [Ferrovum myxofaciens]